MGNCQKIYLVTLVHPGNDVVKNHYICDRTGEMRIAHFIVESDKAYHAKYAFNANAEKITLPGQDSYVRFGKSYQTAEGSEVFSLLPLKQVEEELTAKRFCETERTNVLAMYQSLAQVAMGWGAQQQVLLKAVPLVPGN
jgi:hypothetical protein